MYNIIRNYSDGSHQLLHTNMNYADAKAHTLNPEHHSNTCKLAVNRHRTKRLGVWFDTMVEVANNSTSNNLINKIPNLVKTGLKYNYRTIDQTGKAIIVDERGIDVEVCNLSTVIKHIEKKIADEKAYANA